jgi:hypothetical protein
MNLVGGIPTPLKNMRFMIIPDIWKVTKKHGSKPPISESMFDICSMYGIFTYIWFIFRANAGYMEHMGLTYTMHNLESTRLICRLWCRRDPERDRWTCARVALNVFFQISHSQILLTNHIYIFSNVFFSVYFPEKYFSKILFICLSLH